MLRLTATISVVVLLLLAIACPVVDSRCPGLYCACPCPDPMTCGPNGSCTKRCSSSSECSGGACLGGHCAIVCTPGGPDDCAAAGVIGAECVEIGGANVCAHSDTE